MMIATSSSSSSKVQQLELIMCTVQQVFSSSHEQLEKCKTITVASNDNCWNDLWFRMEFKDI